VYCAALCDRLESVTSNVNKSFYWQLLSAEKYFTVLRVTPPPPLRTALCWPCILRTSIVWPRVLRTVYNKNNHVWRFHLHKEDKMRVDVQSFLKTLALRCLLVRFPSFLLPPINVLVKKKLK